MSARIEEVPDDAADVPTDNEGSHSEEAEPVVEVGNSSTSKKSKKKKKSKASRAAHADAIPQELVDHVVKEIQVKHGAGAPGTDEPHVRMALDRLRVMDVLRGKTGIGGKNRKEMGEHKVRKRPRILGRYVTDALILS